MLRLPDGYTIGLDAEFILRSMETGLPVSAIGKLGGTKERPRPVPFGALQEDGVLAEINIDPARDIAEWRHNIRAVLDTLRAEAEKFNCYVDMQSITAEYPDSELRDLRAWESGCDPDFNCWTGEMNPSTEFDSPLRTCGGHVHVGVPDTEMDRLVLAQFMDRMVGDAINRMEPDNIRRQLYGSPGSFRPKPYGVEIRSPSNWWLALNVDEVFKLTHKCLTTAIRRKWRFR